MVWPIIQPDDSLLNSEGTAKGLPPVQVSSSVDHLDEGHLGEVTHRGGAVTSPNPPISLTPPPPKQKPRGVQIVTKLELKPPTKQDNPKKKTRKQQKNNEMNTTTRKITDMFFKQVDKTTSKSTESKNNSPEKTAFFKKEDIPVRMLEKDTQY